MTIYSLVLSKGHYPWHSLFQLFRLPLTELIGILAEDDDILKSNIYILAPEDEYDTEVDSDESDKEHIGNINQLPRYILSHPCKMTALVPEIIFILHFWTSFC